jgi:hypothetical protein
MRDLFRSMRASEGLPLVKSGADGLGVRVGYDIIPDDNELVEPGGGMSVTPDDPQFLPRFCRPERLGGTGRHPLWRIAEADLSAMLAHRMTDERHGQIEPAMKIPLSTYESALTDTRTFWVEVP